MENEYKEKFKSKYRAKMMIAVWYREKEFKLDTAQQ